MNIKEFTERTGFYPTYEHYKFIEKIARETERYIEDQTELGMHEHDAMEERLNAQQEEIEKLKAQLDAELEWTTCKSAGTQMTQRDYVKLKEDSFTKTMTDEEAANFIAEELGFNVKRVKIIHTVETFEVNKHRRMRVAETYEREPLYESTDWNYVRFGVNGVEYEYIGGQLVLYCR